MVSCDCPSELGLGLSLGEGLVHTSDCGRGLSAPRIGTGVLKGTEGGGRLAAPDIAAFRTRARGGFIPQAKHGANGLWTLAVAGSKFEGTGLENEHIGHIHVAELAGEGSGVGK